MTVEKESKQLAKCYEVSEKTYLSLDRHFKLVRNIFPERKSYSKNQWIQEAVSEYLKKLDYNAILEKADKPKYFNLTLDEDIEREVGRKVDLVRSCGGNYTKRMLVLEAIEAKIQEESEHVKERLCAQVC